MDYYTKQKQRISMHCNIYNYAHKTAFASNTDIKDLSNIMLVDQMSLSIL
ncbi:hypothetical protein Hanom_Chr02g00129991 [Helianthus anomalus]